MKQLIIAVSLILAFAAPAVAGNTQSSLAFACKHCR